MGTLTDPSAQPAATTPLLEVRDLHVRFETSRGTVHAVEGISYSVNRGEIVAVVGESGCGKSVSALAIMRLLAKTGRVPQGQILFEGVNLLDLSEEEMREKRGRDISMIFQEPMTSLNPVLSIGEQVMEPLKIHLKMNDEQATARALELLQLVGITDGPRRLEQYPHHLSGGMRQRVMIAIGLACNPKLIIADEPTTALDVTIQAQILELMKDLSRRLGIAMVVITHNLGIVARYADRVNVMYAARIIEQGTADHVFLEPAHPYSIGLMRSIPRLDLPRGVKLETIEGLPPDLRTPPAGCRFAPRCPYRLDACLVSAPLVTIAPDHASACIRAKEILAGTLVAPFARGAAATTAITAQNGAEPLLVVDRLKKYFNVKAAGAGFMSSETATVKAVNDVSLHVMAGETLGLVGESGCGKTTVGRAVLKLDEPTGGTIRFGGADITHAGHSDMRGVRRKIQVIFQDPYSSLNPRMTVGQIIGEPLGVYKLVPNRKAEHDRVTELLEPGRPLFLHGRALSARALRRSAPARRHCACARARADLHRLRRAGVGARRLDPGADHQPAGRPAGPARPLLPLHRARPRGGAAHLRSRRRHVSREGRGTRRPRRALCGAPASLHQGAARCGADSRPEGRTRARTPCAPRRNPLTLDPAERLRLPYTLSDCRRGMQAGGAGV